jgi:hypothetical protein
MSRFIEIEKEETGERLTIDTYVGRYKRLGMGFLNNLKMNPAFLKHITLTQREESYKPNILNPFFVQLRRFYGDVSYIWTAEVQEERYEKYGERVLHWHVIVAFDEDIDFGREDVFRLQRYWKYGNLDIKPIRKASLTYLMKYISKALDIDVGAKIRRIGSSRIAAYFRMPWNKFLKALSWFLSVGASYVDMGIMKWTYKGASVTFGSCRNERQTKYIYLHPPSGWRRVREFEFDF